MNVPECIDRLTFGSAGNESENQVNSFWLFSTPKGAPLCLGRGRRRKDSNAANVSAPPFSLPRKRGGREKDLGKERRTQGQYKTKGAGEMRDWHVSPPPLPPHLPPFPPSLLPLSWVLKRWDLSKWRNYIKLSSGVMLSCCGFSQSKRSEVSRQDRARLRRLKSVTKGPSCRELSYLFTG